MSRNVNTQQYKMKLQQHNSSLNNVLGLGGYETLISEAE